MSEQKEYNKIEDAIIELLDGELQESVLKFAAYLNENQLTPNMSAWGKIPFTNDHYNYIADYNNVSKHRYKLDSELTYDIFIGTSSYQSVGRSTD